MQYPLVSIICLSFNHANYIEHALNSIWNLDYPNIQLIIADDASNDDSQIRIKKLVKDKDCDLVFNASNIGHCKTFNKALSLAKGEFVIDLAADDMLLPHSVLVAIAKFKLEGESYGVFFADAEIINARGENAGGHFTKSFFKNKVVPQGDIYKILLGKYFINPATMVIRKSLMDKLRGFNEALSYEDFDFWVRSSRITNYCYSPEVTVQKRILSTSVSASQYIKHSKMLLSTLLVCKSALTLNRSKPEDWALLKRVAFEGKMSLSSGNYVLAVRFFILAVIVLFKVRL